MDKSIFLADLIAVLNKALGDAINAANVARETATDAENVAENRYDTLGLEAAYLAHGQSKRALELETTIATFKRLNSQIGQSMKVVLGSLVEVTDESNNRRFFLIGPGAGGMTVISQGQEVLVLTIDAPLGRALHGKKVDDEVNAVATATSGWFTVTRII
ncbi:MAG: GreA/GreB family elongation factor [bacterium]